MEGEGWRTRLTVVAIELAILALAWYFLGLVQVLVWSLAGLIIATGLFPSRYSMLASGVGFCAFAAELHLYFGATNLAALLGVVGVVMLCVGAIRLRQSRREDA